VRIKEIDAITVAADVPEPASLALIGLGLAAMRMRSRKIYGPPPFCKLLFLVYDVSRLAQIYPASDGDLLRATMRVAPVGPKKPLGL
jgi:hypothetical protein